jgi:serine/threonine protein phosphatase 1
MDKYFVASDIHSAYTPWRIALNKAGFDENNPNHKVVVCGDLFDRMSETVQVYNFAKEMNEQGRLIYIRGNHEWLLKECVKEIRCGVVPSSHHFSNGTVKTICQFCGQNEWIVFDPTWRSKISEIMESILDFIDENCVNYAEIGDYILVHSWIPVINKDGLPSYYTKNRSFEFNSDWRNATQEEWDAAAWGNPFDMAERGLMPDKTIIFGHWHCSTGWAKAEGREEFGDDAKFEPYYGDGFIAIDACTAYSTKCNVIVIEEDDTNGNN